VINTINYKKELSGIERWVSEHGGMIKQGNFFARTYEWLKGLDLDGVVVHEQTRVRDVGELGEVISGIVSRGGEGVVLRDPWSVWTPERSHQLLKIKGIEDDEAIVTGYTEGKGKLEGMMGALVTNYKGNRLELSGFTEEERRTAKELFPVGSVVTFQYWRKSDNGVPKEARYLRVRAKN
jgi:DNA ligase-1